MACILSFYRSDVSSRHFTSVHNHLPLINIKYSHKWASLFFFLHSSYGSKKMFISTHISALLLNHDGTTYLTQPIQIVVTSWCNYNMIYRCHTLCGEFMTSVLWELLHYVNYTKIYAVFVRLWRKVFSTLSPGVLSYSTDTFCHFKLSLGTSSDSSDLYNLIFNILVEMTLPTNPKPTIYRNMYENSHTRINIPWFFIILQQL